MPNCKGVGSGPSTCTRSWARKGDKTELPLNTAGNLYAIRSGGSTGTRRGEPCHIIPWGPTCIQWLMLRLLGNVSLLPLGGDHRAAKDPPCSVLYLLTASPLTVFPVPILPLLQGLPALGSEPCHAMISPHKTFLLPPSSWLLSFHSYKNISMIECYYNG